jgi:serine/threonine protein kinase
MNTPVPYRLCPKCGSHRGVEEFICANDIHGVPCSWDLTSEEIRDAHDDAVGPSGPAGTSGTADTKKTEQVELRCPNGHAVSAGDLLCRECNCDLQTFPAEQQIAGWVVLSELPTAVSVRTSHRVRRSTDGRDAILTLYSPGSEPDTTVYEALQRRVPRDHIAELLEYGRWEGQAYEVAEEILGGSLATLECEPTDTATVRQLVEEIGKALAAFMDVGLRHRALSPEKILVRSREPLDIVITGFESGRLSELDLDVESPLEITRYTAPEAIMGGVASASDWWGLGMILLGLVTRGECFSGVNDQLFLIHVNANGAPIPQGLDPRVELLLQGLLTLDRSQRWQWKEVRAWLNGESPRVTTDSRAAAAKDTGPTLSLGGKTYTDVRRFAIDASRSANWCEACDLLAHGQIARWAEDLKLDGRTVSGLRDLGQRVEPAVEFRLGIALQMLNPQLPLILDEEIVNPAWLLNNPVMGYELISGPIPDLLSQYGLQTDNWLQRLAKRATAIRDRAHALEITLDEQAFQVLALSTSRAKLTASWEIRRRDFPEASHSSLSSILARTQYSDEDLILLLAASIDQFRSCEEIIQDVGGLASRYGLPIPAADEIRGYLAGTRRDIYALLDERIAGFARCGQERLDAWADQFRLERRLPIANVLLLLNVPTSQWARPPHQAYVSSVLDFFAKKVSGAILRGQLVRMTIAKTTPRIDITELAPDRDSATALLENLLQRSDRTFRLEKEVFEEPDSPEKRMRTLLSRTLQYQRDTGINGTYIGFPFLLRRDNAEKSAPRLAPILLWPVKVVGQVGSRGDFSLAFDRDGREVLLNPAFTGMFGLEGAKEWQAIAADVLMRSASKLADVIDAFGVKAAPAGRILEPLPRDLKDVPAGEEQCVCSAVLFHMEFMGQSLVKDLQDLKQLPPDNSALEPMLRIADTAVGSGHLPETNETHVAISDKFLITHSDPSQEEAIIRARSAPGLLIQGPPGTGKSQTIVNLVADCIGHRKTVLIVCQKLPALEVVRKRLVAEGLENRLAMVTDIAKDRQPLLRAIREQIDTLALTRPSDARQNAREAAGLASQIEKLEAQIDGQYDTAVRIHEVPGRSYRQILAELIALEETTGRPPVEAASLRRLLAEHSDVTVADLEESCGAVAGQWLKAEYENSPLAATLQFPHDDATLAEFRSAFEDFTSSEAARATLPPRRTSSLASPPPEGLDAWLLAYRDCLQELTDSQLAEAVPLLPVCREGGVVDRYCGVLEALIGLRRRHIYKPLVAEGLQDLLTSLSPEHAEAISRLCGQHASLWLAAHYEDSPLQALRKFGSDPEACRTVQAAVQDFDTAEQHRLLATQKNEHAISPGDPNALSAWLDEHGATLLAVSEEHVQAFAQCSGAFEPDRHGSQYIAILERLDTIGSAGTPGLEAPQALQAFLSSFDEAQAEHLAEEMSGHVADWLEARYEASPLHVLSPFAQDEQTHEAFRRDFAAFLAAEEAKAALRPPSPLALSLHDPEPLRAWLSKYGDLLRSLSEQRLVEVASRLSLFESPAVVSAYIRLLRHSLNQKPDPHADEKLLVQLQETLGPLSDAEFTAVRDECKAVLPLWREAQYERSPLRVLLPFGGDQQTCGAFRRDFDAFVQAEEARTALGTPVGLTTRLHSPDSLAAWLESDGQQALQAFEAQPELVARLLRVTRDDDLLVRYEKILQLLKASHEASEEPLPHVPALASLLESVSDSVAKQTERECMAAADVWLESLVDKVLLDSLNGFPRDLPQTKRLRDGLSRLADAERSRIALAARCPPAMHATENAALREWLAKYEHTLSSASVAAASFLVSTHSLYERDGTGKSRAEILFGDLQELRAVLRRLGTARAKRPIRDRLVAMSPQSLNDLASAVATLLKKTPWLFLSPAYYQAKRAVARWRNATGTSVAEISLNELSRQLGAAIAIRGVHQRASDVFAAVSLPPPPADCTNLDVHLGQLMDLFPGVHELRRAINSCPAPIDRERVLTHATPASLQRLVDLIRHVIATHDAIEHSLAALTSIAPFMSPSWVNSRRALITEKSPQTHEDLALTQLIDAISQLDKVQAFRDRVTGFQPLTLKVLGALTPLRESLCRHAPTNRALALRAVYRHHRLLAGKRYLESTDSALVSAGAHDREHVMHVLEGLAATRRIRERLERCPLPEAVTDAFRSGSVTRASDALHECHTAVAHARAVRAAATALENCQKWFVPEWIESRRNCIQNGTASAAELETLRAAFPTLAVYQSVRARVENTHPIVPRVMPLLASAASEPHATSDDDFAAVDGLMTTAWYAAQRQLLAAHNNLLQSLGECRSLAQQEQALSTLLGARDLSEAVLACPVTGDLHSSLASGSREKLLHSLAALESAVAFAQAATASQEALAACEKWFSSGFIQKCRHSRSQGVSVADALRPVAAAIPTLGNYQLVRDALASPDAGLLRDGLGLLGPLQESLRAIPRDRLPDAVRQLVHTSWLEGQRERLEATAPGLRHAGQAARGNYNTRLGTLRAVRDVVRCLAASHDQEELRTAIASGRQASVRRTVTGLKAGLEIHHAQQASLAALETLAQWFDAEWVTARRTAIYQGQSNLAVLASLLAASSRIEKFQLFRSVLASSEPIVEMIFGCMKVNRPQLETLSENEVASAVEWSVHHAALSGTLLKIEKEQPALLGLYSVSLHQDGTESLAVLARAKRLQEALHNCPVADAFASAVAKRRAGDLGQFLKDCAEAAEHGRAVRCSIKALQNLDGFMQPDWVASMQQAILRGEQTLASCEAMTRSFPTLRAYQLFRSRIPMLSELAVRCFEVLAKYRGALQGAADARDGLTAGDIVRQTIRREALLGWKNRLEVQDPVLLADGPDLAAKVDRLRTLDVALRDLNRQRLSQDLPVQDIDGRDRWTDITRLSGPRAVRLREFFGRGCDLGLLALRPVWLTTPDVASQLLPLEKALFDLVIFDEASQMPVEYALPCLFRAKTAVVSGDDKQMPPSSFFAGRIESDEAEIFDGEMPDEAATEQEREAFEQAWNRREIKDCPDLLHLGDAVLKRATLQVHYRSEYRELIGYSNAAFYQNELGVPVRHPDAAVRSAKPIEYLHVGGTYVSQTNPDEAQKVVDLLAALWTEGAGDPPSVGVVTFNLQQAELIEEKLEERAEADEAFRLAYAREQSRTDRGEDMSVFVKNVENVQGDERDLIIFSTTFGPTEKGVFRRNFGALTHKGGERRLNVAVTRARRKVMIVTSMPIDDVSDMLRTRRKPETPRDYLQAYLQYARLASEGHLEEARRLTGRLVTTGKLTEAAADAHDGFLESVANFIRSLGHEPVNTANDPILGVDFSIADPATGLFGVGIECDPPRHRLTQRARAREIWRPSVLGRAYRVVHRVSPYAWYHERDEERQRLRTVIVGALGKSPAQHGQPEGENS